MRIASTGTVSISSATAGSSGAGALVVTGGLATGAASFIGGDLTVSASSPILYLTRLNTANNTQLHFRTGATSDWQQYISGATPSLRFYANGADRFTLEQTGAATFSGAVTAGGTIQVTANTTPSGGSGLEIQGGATPTLFAYNRTGSAYLPLIITGSTLSMKMNNVDAFTLTGASAAASTATFAGAVKAVATGATNSAFRATNDTSGGTANWYMEGGTASGAFTSFRIVRGNGAANYTDAGFNLDSYDTVRFNLNRLGGSGGTFTIYDNTTLAATVTATAATFAGTVIAPAATASLAPLRIPHGTAPTSPTNGDMWTTTAGLYIRINGATVGPLS